MYNESMQILFKQTPTMKSKPLSHDKKHNKLLTYIGGEWYTKKILRHYHHVENRS